MLLGLPHLEVAGWGGIYSHHPKTSRLVGLSVAWCTGQSGAHQTCPVRQPRHPNVRVLIVGALTAGPAWMFGGTPDMYCRVSGAPLRACLTSAALWRALNARAARAEVRHAHAGAPDNLQYMSGAPPDIQAGPEDRAPTVEPNGFW